MKLITHKLVLYDKGFKFEWVKKEPFTVRLSGGDIVALMICVYILLVNYL